MKLITITTLLLSLGACKTTTNVSTITPNVQTKSTATTVAVIPATTEECPSGGSAIVSYTDLNKNFQFDSDEPRASTSLICNGSNGNNGSNGSNGANGKDGSGAGILITPASTGSCTAGGSILSTYTDTNNNGQHDDSEPINSTTTLCNGVNGSNGANGADGKGAHISVMTAPLSSCPNGGVVYTTGIEGDPDSTTTVICDGANGMNGTNGTNGADGTPAHFLMGTVGDDVNGKAYSACHHDYLYFPGPTAADRGWLTFRHQANGAADQGIGSTGFQVWNVDIADFALASEVGGVTYCTLHWDSAAKMLTYVVNDASDVHQGETGTIDLSATP